MSRHWRLDAACRGMDTEAFYPTSGALTPAVKEALATCERCPVRVDCLEAAIAERDRDGIRGGLLPDSQGRRGLSTKRRRDVPASGPCRSGMTPATYAKREGIDVRTGQQRARHGRVDAHKIGGRWCIHD